MPPTLPTTAPATTGGDALSLGPFATVPFLPPWPLPVATLEGCDEAVPAPTPAVAKSPESKLELDSVLEDEEENDDEELDEALVNDRRLEAIELDDSPVNVEEEL
jgi:hypothetical protein